MSETVRVTSIVELAAGVPAMVGAVPHDAAVVVLLNGARLVLTAHTRAVFELGSAAQAARTIVEGMVPILRARPVTTALTLVWGQDVAASAAYADAIAVALAAEGCGGRAFTVCGGQVADTAGNLEGVLTEHQAAPFAMLMGLTNGLPADSVEQINQAWTGHGTLTPATAADREHLVAGLQHIARGLWLDDQELTRVLAGVQVLAWRDEVITPLLDPGTVEASITDLHRLIEETGVSQFVDGLRQAGARCAPGHRAPLWTVAGVVAWAYRQPAVICRAAIEAAGKDDPTYALVHLMYQMLTIGIEPPARA